MSIPLWRWSVADLAQAIREKKVSSREVAQAHLARIEAVNLKVNAVTVVLAEEALRAADAADARVAAGVEVGPLHGVPITVKENLDLVGSATTHGVVGLKDSLPESDAPVIAHLKAAGAIPIGRTNLPDFGLRWHTDNDLRGATLNPWDPAVTPGGSSGGEAAAIATGMSPLGVGNDMGGSLRYPALCCGIAALKPGLGRISGIFTEIFPDPPLFYEQVAAVNGPMARHVGDLRLALKVMGRPDPRDPWWSPAPTEGPAMARPIKVALTRDPAGQGAPSPAVVAAVEKAAAILAAAGYRVEEADPPGIAESDEVIQQISDMEIQSYLPGILPMMSEGGRAFLEGVVGETAPDLETYMKAIGRRQRIARDWNLFFERTPLVLGPVSTRQAFAVGEDLAGPAAVKRFIASIALTEICNLLGLPSVALPVEVAEGLPQGVQLIAPRFREDLCLDAAAVIEGAQGVFTPIEPRGQSRVPA
jgi:amidase